MVHSDSDEDLGSRLDSALRTGLGSDQVDVGALLTGSRRRARRLRSQRVVGATAAVVLLIGVPAGFEMLRAPAGSQAPPAALIPSVSPPSRAKIVASPRPRPVAGPADPVPALMAAELPPGLSLVRAAPAGVLPIVAGQTCPPAATAPKPARVQHWAWRTSTGAGPTVDLTLTHWAAGGGAPAFQALIQDAGYCRWSQPQTRQPFPAPPGDDGAAWSSDSASDSGSGPQHYGRAVVRVGDVIVGVEVQHQDGLRAAVALAQKLARTEAGRLAAG